MTLRIDNVVTSGIFTLDGEDFAVAKIFWFAWDGGARLGADAACGR
jgi:hypothetical protein